MPNATRDLDAALLRTGLSGALLGEVLEVGCGSGKNTQWLTQHGSVTGLDISPKMLERCRQRAPAATLQLADLTLPWPVEDESIDTVVVDLVLEHIEDLDHIASESARVLRAGGRLRLCELHPWRQHLGKAARFKDAGEWVEPPSVVHTTEEYVTAFLQAGLVLDALSEPRAAHESPSAPPRLLVLSLSLPGR